MKKRILKSIWDHKAVDYDDNFESQAISQYIISKNLKILKKYFSSTKRGFLLDLGCGTGRDAIELARSGFKVYGIDISSEMIKIAKSGITDNESIEFLQGDSEHIPYEDEHFDAVICSSSFHHYPRPVASLSEIRRVLKKNGHLFLLETCRDGFRLIIIHDLIQKTFRNDHIRYYSTKELRRFLELAGFVEIKELLRDQGLFRHGKLITSEVLLRATK